MNFLKVTAQDIKRILKNRFITVSVIAIIITPIFYSLFYLSSFWDPYGNIQDLPVAVVNLDKGTNNDSKSVNYGRDLVDELKTNKDVGWRFVSEQEADSGLTGKKYYGEVIIPEDFSQKALSAKNGTPQKPDIIFKDNPKKNYIAVKIASSIKTNLDEKITKSLVKEYTKVTFDNLYDVKDGMTQASDGSGKITDGIANLKDGSGKLVSAVPALQNGSNQIKTGLASARDGNALIRDKLASAKDGTNQLKDGSWKLNDKILQVQSGVDTLSKGSNKLSSGLANAKSGTDQLKNGLSDAKNGSGQLKDGLNTLNSNTPDLQKNIKKLADGSQQELDSLTKVAKGVEQVNNAVNVGSENAPSLVSALGGISSGSKTLGKNLSAINNAVSQGDSSLSASVNNMSTGTETLNSLLKKYNSPDTSAEEKQQLMEQITTVSNVLNSGAKSLNTAVNSNAGLKTSLSALNSAVNGDSGLAANAEKIYKNVSSGENNLSSGLKTINYALNNENSDNLLTGMKQISEGTNTLNTKVVPELSTAISNLYNGSAKLDSGNTQLYNGAVNLNAGTDALYNGSIGINNGLNTLVSGTPALASGAGKLYDGISNLDDGNNKLYNGASALSDGANKLYTAMVKLNDGNNQVYNGVMKINDGNNKVYDGSKELTDELSDGSNKLNNNLKNSSTAMGNFVSQPVNVETQHLFADETYGTALAPYFIPISIWVGALLMFFVIPDTVEKSIKARGKSIVLGKYIVYILVGTLQAVCVSTVVMIIGIRPSNVLALYLFNIFTSWVFIALMQCLIFLLKDVGRLIAIIILVLQLASSAGTFPIELSPKFYRVISPFMPFTYVVSALREIINGINYNVLGKDILFLLAVFIVFFTLSMIFKDKVSKLHEVMESNKNKSVA
ncbi:hypothetical protein CPAST_c08050 [Clostridium pasteurianum DSM 525 = ATCC 6013]|uniref:YhgE/Pip C-terminal domain protein n=1 Tax=Clostridium pasteurianum DSM 525 = ATCC 6013 TaxID=1262449 RepID=A0A0H3J7E3_CLOPA|nr:YhgE/Pip domain-containing protein [Clostridium pasteurianum]AJA46905.1 hypothetical protein CPAST_c08050 [Clostridium pasteurianum DSM 525 = ATCC 6013]AJA50893.1 hypothetical protein CLPA_c08050 [Clostridium pasteurianum DSM 525 = ATCC 6013]AOZ74289.1 hypothetical protein AQ983_03890 [Clostridium pasteurianum DSM 525 = ATCC 6013]ELP58155.1 YhgE/Pip C-terminal domain-containing protein [Clostridium pasteurianum DSM 525 = ATCC 6013]KRU13098.1 YhgE/Pip C-terminal domain protein [Clostridium p